MSPRPAPTVSPQQYIDRLVNKLDDVMKQGSRSLLLWIEDYCAMSDDFNVREKYRDKVIQKFADAGYIAGDCTGDKFIKGDIDCLKRYIIGQFMIEADGITPIHAGMVSNWVQYFIREQNLIEKNVHTGKLARKIAPASKITFKK